MIEATHLTKRFGPKTAVDDLSFTVAPGMVTGFLGPNGAWQAESRKLTSPFGWTLPVLRACWRVPPALGHVVFDGSASSAAAFTGVLAVAADAAPRYQPVVALDCYDGLLVADRLKYRL